MKLNFSLVRNFLKNKKFVLKTKPSPELNHTDVKRLSFRLDKTGEPIRLGGGFHDVYLGNLIFKNGVRKRVTIKRFNKGIDILKLDDVTARKYQKVINALRQIELEHDAAFPKRQLGKSKMLPKMGMVKMDLENGPEWVLVSQAFVKGNASKFENKTVDYKANPSEFTWILLKLGEKGFINSKQISMVADVFSHHQESSFIPLDIDFAQTIDVSHRKTKTEVTSDILSGLREHIFQLELAKNKDLKIDNLPAPVRYKMNKEYNKLFRYLVKHEMHKELRQLLIESREKYLIK